MKTVYPYVIAEIASAHEGDPVLCRRLAELAASTGADAIKFQIFRRDILISQFHEMHSNFGEIELTEEDWLSILTETAEGPCDVIVEVFDQAALALAERAGCVAAYKLPTSDISNDAFLRSVAATGKPVMLGVGGALKAEIAHAVELLKNTAGDVVLMHGFQAYPTKLEDTHLVRLTAFAREFECVIGYADHVDASDRELARIIPAMALAAGATVIEKHFTDSRARKGRDHYSALSPDEFAEFVAMLRTLSIAMGDTEDRLRPAEETYRHQMKRYAVAARDLTAGTLLESDMLTFKRTNRPGITHGDVDRLQGRRLRIDLPADTPISEDALQ